MIHTRTVRADPDVERDPSGDRSSFVRILHDQRPGREHLRGLFHLLTGESIELDAQLLSRLRAGDAGEDVQAVRDALCERWHLSNCTDFNVAGDDPLEPWLDHHLTIPVHTPTLAVSTDEATTIYRPEDLAHCRLPRDARIPRVIREELRPECGHILRLAVEGVRLATALARIGIDSGTALEVIRLLADPDRQLIRLVTSRRQTADLRAQHQYPMQNFVVAGPRDSAGRHYEDSELRPEVNFDWLEPTIAHSFRFATNALRGREYGAAWFDLIKPHAKAADGRPRILEAGAGTGSLALSFLQAAREATGGAIDIEYHILDRSPALLQAQRERLRTRGFEVVQHQADAQRAGPPDLRFDHVLCNEVIADFEVDSDSDGHPRQTGAMAFIRRLTNLLAPGGRAYISEYGSLAAPARRVEHLAHEEYAVDFGRLRRFAASIGLNPRVCALKDLIRVNEDAAMLIGQQEKMLCLQALFDEHGMAFESCAYDRDRFETLYGEQCARLNLIGPAFAPLSAGLHFGPDLNQFLVLILEQPSQATGNHVTDGS